MGEENPMSRKHEARLLLLRATSDSEVRTSYWLPNYSSCLVGVVTFREQVVCMSGGGVTGVSSQLSVAGALPYLVLCVTGAWGEFL